MAIPNINKILEAQEIQRGGGKSYEESSENEVMEILQLIFEYMKENNKKIQNQLEEIHKQEQLILKEIEKLKLEKQNESNK